MARSNLGSLFSSLTNLSNTTPKLAIRSKLGTNSLSRLVSSSTVQQQEGIKRQQEEKEAIKKSTENKCEEEDDEEDGCHVNKETGEIGGPKGPEPTRYGDWEKNGRCYDF